MRALTNRITINSSFTSGVVAGGCVDPWGREEERGQARPLVFTGGCFPVPSQPELPLADEIRILVLSPYKGAKLRKKLSRKLSDASKNRIKKTLEEKGELSLGTVLTTNPGTLTAIMALKRLSKQIPDIVAAGASALASTALTAAGGVGVAAVSAATGQGGLIVLGVAVSPWVLVGMSALGAGVGLATAGLKVYRDFKDFKDKQEAGDKAGRERIEIDLPGATDEQKEEYSSGYEKAKDPDLEILDKSDMDRLSEFEKKGYEAYKTGTGQQGPGGQAAYEMALEKLLDDLVPSRGERALPELVTSWVPQPLPEDAVVLTLDANASRAANTSGSGNVQADPEAVRAVAEAISDFNASVEDLKAELVGKVSEAREGWTDDRGARVEANITDMLGAVNVSETAQELENGCRALAAKLDAL